MITDEKKDILISVFALSFSFSIVFSGKGIGLIYDINNFIFYFLISFFTVGIGFIFHELAHKYVAIYYGCRAKYIMNQENTAFMVFLAIFLNFIIAATGAVYIVGNVNTKRNAIISIAGPLINIIIAILFLFLNIYTTNDLLIVFSYFGFMINSFLAFFNLIPFYPLDGSKIYVWNKFVWGFLILTSLFLFLYSQEVF